MPKVPSSVPPVDTVTPPVDTVTPPVDTVTPPVDTATPVEPAPVVEVPASPPVAPAPVVVEAPPVVEADPRIAEARESLQNIEITHTSIVSRDNAMGPEFKIVSTLAPASPPAASDARSAATWIPTHQVRYQPSGSEVSVYAVMEKGVAAFTFNEWVSGKSEAQVDLQYAIGIGWFFQGKLFTGVIGKL